MGMPGTMRRSQRPDNIAEFLMIRGALAIVEEGAGEHRNEEEEKATATLSGDQLLVENLD